MNARRARAWDALTLVLVVCVLFELVGSDQDVPLGLSVPVGLAMTVPFLFALRWPVPVVAVVLGAWVVQGLAGDWTQEPQSELLPAALAFWVLGAHLAGRRSLVAFGVGFALLVVHEPGDVIVLGPLMAGVYAAGRLMQSRERLAAALQQERVQAERYAVAEERARIARELHDVVGHAIATMTVQAGAERMALGDARPETTAVLGQIEATGRQTLQEMRRLLGVLRTDDDATDFTPQPGLAQLGVLAERIGAAGVTVDLVVDDGGPLTPGIDISAYRIVQEALTNVLKHAGTDAARVRVREVADVLEIEVTDAGAGARTVGSGGHGLTGMRERVAVYGGSLEAGPGPSGGWRLFARLPKERVG